MEYKTLIKKGAMLNDEQLENYLEKVASDHVLQNNSDKQTYPIPILKENFEKITQVYNLLNEHIKLGIPIHPAGEWLLDNFYIIEETVKGITKQLTLKEYTKFLGVQNGTDKGFARVYVLASEIVAYTDCKIDGKTVKKLINAYQQKKALSMEEIWNIGLFLNIALIQEISQVCEKIYYSQMQKYRVENIIERLVENKEELKYKNLSEYKAKVKGYGEMKYPFIEYMSFSLRRYGKASLSYIKALEEQVNKMGTTIEEVIKKEHFDIAVKRVSMANAITSIKELSRVNFLEIFEQINGVEEILRKDPIGIYEKMDYKTKEYYRNSIKEISKKTKISEIYIAQTALELSNIESKTLYNEINNEINNEKSKMSKEHIDNINKKSHIGYYLISEGKEELLKTLQYNEKTMQTKTKINLYIYGIWAISILINTIISYLVDVKLRNIPLATILWLLRLLPIQEITNKIVQYILAKVVKPKLIPKMDFSNGVPKEYATFVVIPTILKSSQKVKELIRKLEVYYLANESENLYFALLGDCSSGKNKEEKFDEEVIQEGLKQVKILNEKYQIQENKMPKFNFIYRKRFWNGQEECYLGWERKRGLLNQFNEYILGNEENVFRVNTIEDWKKSNKNFEVIPKIKYIITLDADTNLTLNSGLELIGAMAHILNVPELNETKDAVIKGHALIQPRIGIDLESAGKNLFTKIFVGAAGTDLYTNAIFDVYQDNFDEAIFTGKGIYDLEVFSKVLKDEIPENTVLSHDLLEGSYLRAGLATDIMLMDGYPSSYNSYELRNHRWVRGDFQITRWLKKYITDKKQNKKINPLNKLSKFKIFDNLIRAILPITTIITFIYLLILNKIYNFPIVVGTTILFISATIATILDIADKIVYRKEGKNNKKSFENAMPSYLASIARGIISIMSLPDKAYRNLDAIAKTIYRQLVTKKYLLEWVTSEEAEKMSKTDIISYYKNMIANVLLGVLRTCLFNIYI